MTKKIFASLKDKTQVILFDERSKDFNDVIELFNYDVQNSKIIAFLDNLHSTLDEDELYFVRYRNKIIISPLKGRYLMDKLMRTKFSFPISMMNVYSERGALVPLDIEGPLQVIKGRKTGALE